MAHGLPRCQSESMFREVFSWKVKNCCSLSCSHGDSLCLYPIGSMYAIYGNIYHPYTPNVSIYTIHGSYGYCCGLRTCGLNCCVHGHGHICWFLDVPSIYFLYTASYRSTKGQNHNKRPGIPRPSGEGN